MPCSGMVNGLCGARAVELGHKAHAKSIVLRLVAHRLVGGAKDGGA